MKTIKSLNSWGGSYDLFNKLQEGGRYLAVFLPITPKGGYIV